MKFQFHGGSFYQCFVNICYLKDFGFFSFKDIDLFYLNLKKLNTNSSDNQKDSQT